MKKPTLNSYYRILAATALVVVPLFFILGISRSFDFSKSLLFRLLMLAVLLGFALSLLFKNKFKVNAGRLFNPGTLLVGGLFMVIFLATVFSPASIQAVHGNFERGQGLIQWAYYMLFFIFLVTTLDKAWIKRITTLLLGAGSLISIYAIFQSFGIDPIFGGFNTDFFVGREFSTLGNPDFMGQYLGLLVPMGVAVTWWTKPRWLKVFPIMGLVVIFWALFLSESRSPIFGLGIASLMLIGFLIVKYHKKIKKHRSILAKIGLALGVILAAVLIIVPVENIPLLNRFVLETENIRSLSSRFVIWNVAIQLIMDHPFLGVGPDNFAIFFPEYIKPAFYVLEEDINISADRAHNDLLSFGIMAGIPGLLLYASLAAWSAKAYFKQKKFDLPVQATFMSLFVYFGQNVFSFSETSHYLLFFFLLASAVIWTTKNDIQTVIFSKITTRMVAVFLLLVIPFSFSGSIWRPLASEAFYTTALIYELNGDSAATKFYMNGSIEIFPYWSRTRYNLLMRFAEEVGPQIQVIRQIEGDTINVLAWEAVSLSGESYEEAFELFRQTIELNPNYAHTQRAYGDALFRTENYAGAIIQYEIYFDLVPEFWTWCPDIENMSEADQKTYRVFYKNVPDFNNTLIHLLEAYRAEEDEEQVEYYQNYLDCLL